MVCINFLYLSILIKTDGQIESHSPSNETTSHPELQDIVGNPDEKTVIVGRNENNQKMNEKRTYVEVAAQVNNLRQEKIPITNNYTLNERTNAHSSNLSRLIK